MPAMIISSAHSHRRVHCGNNWSSLLIRPHRVVIPVNSRMGNNRVKQADRHNRDNRIRTAGRNRSPNGENNPISRVGSNRRVTGPPPVINGQDGNSMVAPVARTIRGVVMQIADASIRASAWGNR